MSNDVCSLDVQGLEQEEDVLWFSTLVSESSGASESTRVVTNHLVSGFEGRDLIVPDGEVVSPPVNENDGRPLSSDLVVDGSITNIECARLRTERPANKQ